MGDWGNLNTLHAGDKMQVTKSKSKSVTGTFSNVSDTAISLQTGGRSQTIARLCPPRALVPRTFRETASVSITPCSAIPTAASTRFAA